MNIDGYMNNLQNAIDKQIEQTSKEVGIFLRDDARERCPTNKFHAGGELKRSITEKVKDGNIEVFTNMEYAPYVEYGTGVVGQESNQQPGISYVNHPWVYTPDDGEHFYFTHGQKAQPFMYPALHDNKKQIIKKYKADLKKAVRSVK